MHEGTTILQRWGSAWTARSSRVAHSSPCFWVTVLILPREHTQAWDSASQCLGAESCCDSEAGGSPWTVHSQVQTGMEGDSPQRAGHKGSSETPALVTAGVASRPPGQEEGTGLGTPSQLLPRLLGLHGAGSGARHLPSTVCFPPHRGLRGACLSLSSPFGLLPTKRTCLPY